MRVLIDHAFQVDQAGRIDRNAILKLRRLQIDDARWMSAMAAITESIRVDGTTTYFRFWTRARTELPWSSITIDLANARAPGAAGGV